MEPGDDWSRHDAVAAFDFDGTLTTRDSFSLFVAWRRPRWRLAVDLLCTFPHLVCYAVHLTGNETHKMAMFARRFRGASVDRYRELARRFSLEIVPHIIRPEALRRLRYHQQQGHRVVIISASLSDWIEPWAQTHDIEIVLASRAACVDGVLTGALDGANCHGAEKVRRLLERFPRRESYRLFAYGDSRGDANLLAFADFPFLRRFA